MVKVRLQSRLVARLLLCLMLIGAAMPASARIALPALYEAILPVASESAAERDAALRRGLSQVILRLVAQPVTDRQARLAPLLDDAGDFLQQFTYLRDAEDDLLVRFEFDGGALVRALHAAGLPVWLEADRPRILIWLVVDRGSDRVIVGGGDQLELQAALREQAALFGLPIVLPLLDLQDRRAVQPSDLWGGFRAPVMGASARYATDVVLLGRVVEHAGGVRARWQLFSGDEGRDEWSGAARSLPDALRGGLQAATQRLAVELARRPGEQVFQGVRLSVDGVDGLEDYGYLRRRLAQLRGIERIDVVMLESTRVLLHVQSVRDADQLRAELARSSARLESVASDQPDGAALWHDAVESVTMRLVE